jgi:membrane-bound serine protease (ClpP class)
VAAEVPVYVYVSPTGGRAASAGVFITYSSDVAAMAPGTNIGSATPINSNGEELPKDLRRKVINDAVAQITELAKERDRNEDVAEEAITKAENVGAREALETDVVEYVAKDVRDLLEQSDGATVKPKHLTLHLADAKTTQMDMPLTLRILKHVIDPNVLFLLFGAGLLGLAFELTHPGIVLPGVAGGICLLIALFGLSVLPATGAGISLLVLAAALFAAEAVAPGGGVLGAGGAVALLLGALLLFDDSSGYGVSTPLAIVVAAALAAFFGLVLRKAIATRRLPQSTSGESMAGMVATVRRPIGRELAGMVFVDGELWRARAAHAGDQFEAEDRVRVVRMVGGEVEIEALAGEREGDTSS